MNLLLLYTAHRQVAEFDLQARFLARWPDLAGSADVLVHCNNMAVPADVLAAKVAALPCRRAEVVHRDANRGGYLRGQFEAIADCYDRVRAGGYDWAVHLHPDIFVADGRRLVRTLEAHRDDPAAVLVSRIFGPDQACFATDWFAFRPARVPVELFLKHRDFPEAFEVPLEAIFHDSLKALDIPYREVDRFGHGSYFRDIDRLGLWHEHRLGRVALYFRWPPLRFLVTAKRAAWDNPRLAAAIGRDYLVRAARRRPQEGLWKQLTVT